MAFQLFCDNLSALHMIVNHMFHTLTKHIKLNYHFIQKKVLQWTFLLHVCRPPFRHGSLFHYLFQQITCLARCRYPSGPRVASLVVIRNRPRFLWLQKDWTEKGAAEEKVATEGVAEKVAEKGGCSKDHCGGKSEIRKKERGRGDIGGAVERVRVFLEDRLRRICGQSTYEREKSELEAWNIQQRKEFPGTFINPLYLLLTFECSVICLGWMLKATCLFVGI